MSFVARRLGSAGLVVGGNNFPQTNEATSVLDRNVERESGILRAPMVLAVGVDDDVAALCTTAAREADVGFLRVAHGVAACREIVARRPTVVAIAAQLWADERNIVTDIARSVGAAVVELPHAAPATVQALVLIRAALAVEGCLQAAG
jgi:hypothetical protein